MTKKKHKQPKSNLLKPIALVIILSVIFVVVLIAFPKFSADANANNPLKDSRLSVIVQNPYGEPLPTEFPNGKDFIEATLTASKKDGSPLLNAPILIDKSSSVQVTGPSTTEGGQIQLRFSSNKALIDTVQIKLKDCTTVRFLFKIKFSSDTSVKDLTDRNAFIRGVPVTVMAQIKPRMTGHIASAQARYIYTRRINKWGFWINVRRVATEQMECSDGVCQATYGKDFTSIERNVRGSFIYGFTFTDENGKVFTKSYRGQLRNP